MSADLFSRVSFLMFALVVSLCRSENTCFQVAGHYRSWHPYGEHLECDIMNCGRLCQQNATSNFEASVSLSFGRSGSVS